MSTAEITPEFDPTSPDLKLVEDERPTVDQIAAMAADDAFYAIGEAYRTPFVKSGNAGTARRLVELLKQHGYITESDEGDK